MNLSDHKAINGRVLPYCQMSVYSVADILAAIIAMFVPQVTHPITVLKAHVAKILPSTGKNAQRSIKALIVAFFGVFTLLPSAIHAQQTANMPEELRAVKITNVASNVLFSDESIAEAMNYLASIGINAILPVVQNGGYTQFYSEVMDEYFGKPLDPRLNGRDVLEVVIREAHRNGIEVYPWFEYGFAAHYSGPNGPATGGFIGQTYPGWMSVDHEGNWCKKNGFDWISGINPEVQEFMLKLIMEVVRKYDIDGIEFSDRMPALPRECGYDDATVALYRSEHDGANPSVFPRSAPWTRWRAGKLNDFYRAVRDSVKTYDSELFVASSPNIYPWGYNEYLQDPVTWAAEGIVDHLIPQLYRYNIDDYNFELNKTLADLPEDVRHIYFAGILMSVGSYTISEEYLRASIESNRAAGVAGEAYFFYEGLRQNNNALGDMLGSEFYYEPATVPGRNGEIRRVATSIREHEMTLPSEMVLIRNYPNPFNPSTQFQFELSVAAAVELEVYTVTGRRISTLVNDVLPAGTHRVMFDASELASGVYLYQIRAGDFIQTHKMTLLK